MEMLQAMRACAPGGYVARRAFPNRKDCVDHIDFISKN